MEIKIFMINVLGPISLKGNQKFMVTVYKLNKYIYVEEDFCHQFRKLIKRYKCI